MHEFICRLSILFILFHSFICFLTVCCYFDYCSWQLVPDVWGMSFTALLGTGSEPKLLELKFWLWAMLVLVPLSLCFLLSYHQDICPSVRECWSKWSPCRLSAHLGHRGLSWAVLDVLPVHVLIVVSLGLFWCKFRASSLCPSQLMTNSSCLVDCDRATTVGDLGCFWCID